MRGAGWPAGVDCWQRGGLSGSAGCLAWPSFTRTQCSYYRYFEIFPPSCYYLEIIAVIRPLLDLVVEYINKHIIVSNLKMTLKKQI